MSTVQSVERAFSILRCLASGPLGVSEIADRTDLPKSTVSRLLGTLVETGAVEQSDLLGVYGLGELIIELSSSASPGSNLVSIARPFLVELVEQIGEAAGLGMLDGAQVYYLDQVDGDHEVQVRDWTGESVDAHVVSSGLILMAHVPRELRVEWLAGPLEPQTEHSVTDPAVLARRLDEVRRAGFAWVYEEMSEGLNSVAAPIVNPAGSVIAAVHAHGPSYRFPEPGGAASVAAAVVDTAQRISDRLSGRHRPESAA
ncbi:MAG: IclR family transcriptional regulator [Ilumatobacter sp.]|uniref:IclR family transcriptional regulator n=1 Tax=Ilumatobacter sp. TaxID=1967498 RepID=UPI00260356A7|nr:IclR family transcriptional regulator [Ilumatobacter sp.]MDJ0769100.1 IclR family transcriptional regulator [Ilumatobacter sp.]